VIAIDDSLYNWVDELTFESDREPVQVQSAQQLVELLQGSEPVLAILPKERYDSLMSIWHDRVPPRVLDSRVTFSRPLTPGSVFQKKGHLRDKTLLLISNRPY
jgi:hypothetical protein